MRKTLLAAVLAVLLPLLAAAQAPAGAPAVPADASTTLSIERALARQPSDDPLERLGITWRMAVQRQPVELLIALLLAGGIGLGLWQLLMVRKHLQSTHDALELARAAAHAAKVSAEASHSITDVALKAQQPVLAVVDVVHGAFTLPSASGATVERAAFQLRWKNFGRTAALDCRVSATGHVLPRGEPLPVFEPLRASPTTSTLGPDATVSAPACVFSPEIVAGWLRKESRLVLQAHCTYRSVFARGTDHSESLCVELIATGVDAENRPRFHWVTVFSKSSDPGALDRDIRT